MFTRPDDIDDAQLVAALADNWSIEAVSLEYRPVGFGSHHWHAKTATADWFVTVDDLTAKAREPGETPAQTRARLVAALMTATDLTDAGHDYLVGPMRRTDGTIGTDLSPRYVVTVYPLVTGRTYAYGNYTDPRHRDAVVARLAALHRSPDRCRRWARTETFSIARRPELFDTYPRLDQPWDHGPFAEPARQLLATHTDAVERAFSRYDQLVEIVRCRPERYVLTHGEPHPANTISTDHGVVLVDWDTTLIAPPERDLWDLIGEDPAVAARYQSLTGAEVDPHGVDLYRLAWDLTEIAIYLDDFQRPHEHTADTAEAWKNLQHFLDPARW